jgi:nitrite reductase (cytochrome c-552)
VLAKSNQWVLITVLAAFGVIVVAGFLINIFERKQEAQNQFVWVVQLNGYVDDPAIWGKQFPMEYDLYKHTTDMERTRYGGSEGLPHSPTEGDPIVTVAIVIRGCEMTAGLSERLQFARPS